MLRERKSWHFILISLGIYKTCFIWMPCLSSGLKSPCQNSGDGIVRRDAAEEATSEELRSPALPVPPKLRSPAPAIPPPVSVKLRPTTGQPKMPNMTASYVPMRTISSFQGHNKKNYYGWHFPLCIWYHHNTSESSKTGQGNGRYFFQKTSPPPTVNCSDLVKYWK